MTDGWIGYNGIENHETVVVGTDPAHEVLDWIHRVFANLKRWGLGVLHGFRCKYLNWQFRMVLQMELAEPSRRQPFRAA